MLTKVYKVVQQQDFTCQGTSADHPLNMKEEPICKSKIAHIKLKEPMILYSHVPDQEQPQTGLGVAGCLPGS